MDPKLKRARITSLTIGLTLIFSMLTIGPIIDRFGAHLRAQDALVATANTATKAAKAEQARIAEEHQRCDSMAEGEADGWLVPDNVFRFQLLRSSGSGVLVRQQTVSDGQVQRLISKVGTCYYIRSVTMTTKSESFWSGRVVPKDRNPRTTPPVEVWNDSLILVLERKR